ncbi:hypothetical protein KC19_10G059800 [Ceratodon purpureus]|uniref:Uncharacterized protein n=1 Tax=Ceratodon purpureus TaxID=3225 RepID=A0A8T0GPD5_CERPU|nr:hypothetical protein KC19_10G059800 [Ceratodon purpureus]
MMARHVLVRQGLQRLIWPFVIQWWIAKRYLSPLLSLLWLQLGYPEVHADILTGLKS